ncbi:MULTISPECIES: hypothetical protein [Gordonia]|uniref:hypothetical protein n=1 Tax=Gordonia TaxID=2053 RepID=UPI00257A956A|nr:MULTISPECIES: hypothetical protein [Gordonia]
MNSIITLDDLTTFSGLDVLDHLDRSIRIPVISGPQAQGDLMIVPLSMVRNAIVTRPWTHTTHVRREGVELLRSAAGGNPHSLVADDGTCTWSSPVQDAEGLALGIIDTSQAAFLIHPEHGATGIAPGRYVIRRQREGSGLYGFAASGTYFVAD